MSILKVQDVSIRYLTGDFKDIGLKEYVMRKLSRNYHITEFWADHHITFSLEKGDMLGIIGTNGAGKSTLLKAISGIMEPTGGYVKREGNIAALLELASGFDGDLTVRENAYLRGAMLGYTRKFMDEKYPEIIEFAELQDFQDRPFKQLSSGMMARLAFSVASLVHPDILILDEVLSVGDGAFRRKSEAKMREIINGGATTILVSHSVEQVREMSNKVLWLEKGEQIGFGDTDLLCDLYQGYLDGTVSLDEAKTQLKAVNAESTPTLKSTEKNQKYEGSPTLKPEVRESSTEIGRDKPISRGSFLCNEETILSSGKVFDFSHIWLTSHISRYYYKVFFSSFALVLLVHLYRFTNLFINHDDVHGTFFDFSEGLSSVRWLLHLSTNLAGNFSSPWLDGVVAAAFLAIACTFFVAIFNVRSFIPACLLSFCIVSFPTTTSIYTYMFNSSQDFLALLLAVLAAWLFRRGRTVTNLLGVLSVACSMGLYQAFFCLTAAILALTMIIDVCNGRWKSNLKKFFITGIHYLEWLALGLLLYLAITKVCLWCTGVKLVDYQGISSMGQVTLPILIQRIKEIYPQLVDYYFNNPMYPRSFPFLVLVSLLADILVIGILLFTHHLHKNILNLLQLAIMLIIFPIACNSICLMVDTWRIHNLMLYPAILPLLLPVLLGSQISNQDLVILNDLSQRLLYKLSVFCACGLLLIQAVFGYQFFVTTNYAYTCMALTYENAYAYFTRLTAKIEMQETYSPDAHVAFLGTALQPSSVPDVYMTGALRIDEIVNMYSRYEFLHYFICGSYHYATQEEIDIIKASPKFQQMPCYPAAGSIATIENVIVVKFSE